MLGVVVGKRSQLPAWGLLSHTLQEEMPIQGYNGSFKMDLAASGPNAWCSSSGREQGCHSEVLIINAQVRKRLFLVNCNRFKVIP